ncbi:ferric reductase-like transmembrane domain-containing protein [Pseudolysinimonas sp.]|uniref:ferric reductase-like transmembrane domain-containing protein n=1 Tax=Pseudolysinimonas sp. TaxID=2680009 RepID=UPI003F7E0204
MSEALWAFGRVSGVVALALLTASLVLGILTRSGRPLPGLPRFAISLIHRNVALLGTVFLVLHVGSLLLDSYAKLHLTDVLVPFLGSFKPFWQGLGTTALDLLIAVVVTALFRRRIGVRAFKAFHWLTYAMWPIALAHAIGNGTNGTSAWFLVFAAVNVVVIAVAVMWRLSARYTESSRAREGAAR